MSKRVNVSVGVLLNDKGEFLLASRPVGKVFEGYWEFPGGKIENGETPFDALSRELDEELGIQVTDATPWMNKQFEYPHATVALHFFRVWHWQGKVTPLENQQVKWVKGNSSETVPLLPANLPVLKALSLPSVFYLNDFNAEPSTIPYRFLLKNKPQSLAITMETDPFSGVLFSRVSQQFVRPSGVEWVGVEVSGEEDLVAAARLDIDFMVLNHPRLINQLMAHCTVPLFAHRVFPDWKSLEGSTAAFANEVFAIARGR